MDVSIEAELVFISNSHAGKLYWFPLNIEKQNRRHSRSVPLGMKAPFIREMEVSYTCMLFTYSLI